MSDPIESGKNRDRHLMISSSMNKTMAEKRINLQSQQLKNYSSF